MGNKKIYLLSVCLITALVLNPFGTNIFELPKIQFLAIFTAITVLAITTHFLKKGELHLRYNKTVYILLGLWLLSLILSTIFSIAPELSFWGSYDRQQGLYSNLVYITLLLIWHCCKNWRLAT